MLLPNRHGSSNEYRYGFQGQEKDDEIKGEGNSLNYTYRMHDPRIVRFFAPDPLEPEYPWYTPYQFSGNKLIAFGEIEGLEEGWVIQGEKVFKVEGPTEQVANSFTTQENAEFAMSQGFKSPKEIGEFLKLQEVIATYSTSAPAKGDIPTINDAGLESTMDKFRHTNPGMTIARGIIDGAVAAPEVIIPEIAVAKLAKFYTTYKASRLATQTANKLTKIDDVVHPEFMDDLIRMVDQPLKEGATNIDKTISKVFDNSRRLDHFINGSERSVHRWGELVPDLDPNKIKGIVKEVLSKGKEIPYKRGQAKTLSITNEGVTRDVVIPFFKNSDDSINFSSGWVTPKG